MTPIFSGRVKLSKLVIDQPSKFREYVGGLEGQSVEVIVRKPVKHRSNPQNRYYFGVVIKLLSEHTGYSADEMHDALRILFLQDHEAPFPRIRSTAGLSTTEFEDYMSKIRQWAASELQVNVPEPNEVEF